MPDRLTVSLSKAALTPIALSTSFISPEKESLNLGSRNSRTLT
jgi:hypothetical protein